MIEAKDERDIIAVLLRYATGIDRRDWPLFRSCFAASFVGDYPGFGNWRGPEAITDFMKTSHEGMGHTLHRLSNFVIDGGAGKATARCYVDALLPTLDGAVHRAEGWYDDELIRSPEGWQISRRKFTKVWFSSSSATLAGP